MTQEPASLDLEDLAFERGGHVLVKLALAKLPVGGELAVRGRADALDVHLAAFCRAAGLELARLDSSARGAVGGAPLAGVVVKTRASIGRFVGAERAGHADAHAEGAIASRPPPTWGLAARGALVEAGVPPFEFALAERRLVWSDEAARLYAQAAAAQWDPATAIPWDAPFELPEEVEDALVQTMTYLIENETAALLVPARFLGCLHPHFREVMQLLSIQVADEARHIEVFTRRATLRRKDLALSTVGGQASLKTLLDEPDWALASFLLSVLGEGSFLALLWFLHQHAPEPVTRELARLAAQDEARHVAFGLAHLEAHVAEDPSLLDRLARAIEARHAALAHTAGLNEEVFDALVLIAAGSFEPAAIARGHAASVALGLEMDEGRQKRLRRLGFDKARAAELSSLHTRNFM